MALTSAVVSMCPIMSWLAELLLVEEPRAGSPEGGGGLKASSSSSQQSAVPVAPLAGASSPGLHPQPEATTHLKNAAEVLIQFATGIKVATAAAAETPKLAGGGVMVTGLAAEVVETSESQKHRLRAAVQSRRRCPERQLALSRELAVRLQ